MIYLNLIVIFDNEIDNYYCNRIFINNYMIVQNYQICNTTYN